MATVDGESVSPPAFSRGGMRNEVAMRYHQERAGPARDSFTIGRGFGGGGGKAAPTTNGGKPTPASGGLVVKQGFGGSSVGERLASSASGSVKIGKTYGKVPKQVDEIYAAVGLTPEEVNEIRYSGKRLDMSMELDFEVDAGSGNTLLLSNSHFNVCRCGFVQSID